MEKNRLKLSVGNQKLVIIYIFYPINLENFQLNCVKLLQRKRTNL